MSEFTLKETLWADEEGSTSEFEYTYESTTNTYEPNLTKLIEYVIHSPGTNKEQKIMWREEHYFEGQLHSEHHPAVTQYHYERKDGQFVTTGKTETNYFHGVEHTRAAELAYAQNKISEEDYHSLVHPEKAVDLTTSEATEILKKGL